MSYGCKCKCETFHEHASGVMFSGKAMPTRKPQVAEHTKTEQRWQREIDAYRRLDKDGYQLQSLNGADVLEKRSTTPIELEHGRLYGDKAETVQKVADGDLVA